MAASFNPAPNFQTEPLLFDPVFLHAVEAGQVAQVQAAGIKVVLTITGRDSVGWGSIPAGEQESLISYLTHYVLGPSG